VLAFRLEQRGDKCLRFDRFISFCNKPKFMLRLLFSILFEEDDFYLHVHFTTFFF